MIHRQKQDAHGTNPVLPHPDIHAHPNSKILFQLFQVQPYTEGSPKACSFNSSSLRHLCLLGRSFFLLTSCEVWIQAPGTC